MPLNDNDLLLINDSQDSNEAKKIKYSTLKTNINGDDGNNFQEVTSNGNITTNAVRFGGGDGNTKNHSLGITGLGLLSIRKDTPTDTAINIYHQGQTGADVSFAISGDGSVLSKGDLRITHTNNTVACIIATNEGASGAPVWQGYDDTLETSRITNDGKAHFAGDVTSDGTIGFNLEANNVANFNAQGDYVGPTLNVKDRLLNLISRVDALEANEIVDDATDSSLLQLIAAQSSRIDSIELRLAALEGGS